MSPANGRGGSRPPEGPAGWYESEPRLPGRGPVRSAGRRPFGVTWWGRAWVDALEHRAQLDPNRLPRGRTYARSGAVDVLTIAPGEITADVQGSRRTPYAVRVRVRAWSDDEWELVLDAMAREIGHTAALLDGELPPAVADDARATGLDLLPGPGEVQPRCTCPDWADPCKHAAAVCYLVADELDADPFALLALRGRRRDEVLAALRSRRGMGTPPPAGDEQGSAPRDPGIPAREVWSREPLPLPVLPLPPSRPGLPTVLGVDAPLGTGLDTAALRLLAADAAARALDLALGAPAGGLELTQEEDMARWAAAALGAADGVAGIDLGTLAGRAGVRPRDLLRRALAWRHGGPGCLAVLDASWDAGPEALARGRALLGPGATGRRNRLTLGERQLRLGHDGRWYPFVKRGPAWDPDGPPIDDAGEDEAGSDGEMDEAGTDSSDR